MNMMFYEIEHDIGMNHFRYMKKTNTVMHTAGHSAVVVAERLGGYLQCHGHGFTCRCFYTLICLQLFHGHDYVAVVPR